MTAVETTVATERGFCFQELIGPAKPRPCSCEADALARVAALLFCGNTDACLLKSVNGGPWVPVGGGV